MIEQSPVDAAAGTAAEPTLNDRIRGEIEARILSGAWPPGYRIPFEVDLAAEYRCSRMTMNKVLVQLARTGLIERRKKSGSFVSQPKAQSAVLQIQDIASEVRSLNLPHSHEILVLANRKANAKDLLRLDVPKSPGVLSILTLHRAGAGGFCLEDRLISLSSVPTAADADFSCVTPGAWLLERVPWSAAEHRISAAVADPHTASQLGIAPGSAVLVVERRTWSVQGPVTQVKLTYPGDRHALVARFTPTG